MEQISVLQNVKCSVLPSNNLPRDVHGASLLWNLFCAVLHLRPTSRRQHSSSYKHARRCFLFEGLDCPFLIEINVKDGIELCDLQHVADLFCEIQQLQRAALFLHACERADQLADPGAAYG